jgi:hypothetical protein
VQQGRCTPAPCEVPAQTPGSQVLGRYRQYFKTIFTITSFEYVPLWLYRSGQFIHGHLGGCPRLASHPACIPSSLHASYRPLSPLILAMPIGLV